MFLMTAVVVVRPVSRFRRDVVCLGEGGQGF